MMKRMMGVFFALFLAGQAMAELKVAVVDYRGALMASDAAQEYTKQLKKEFAGKEEEIRKLGEEAQKLRDRLQKDAAILSETEKARLKSEFDAKVQDFEYLKRKYQGQISQRQEAFIRESEPRLQKALQALIEKGNYDLVLPRQSVIHVKPALDITPELIKQLNAQK
ncbi:OmpH family outer membrane protein [Hahella sp. SMD15-11]|uniref:OmpH family outer membrane protein n=1 Tax=Thermohahella caldifontis TaxID=3142973 RepID=A0AB39V024_9GAMM